jgi:hypothetical protein
VPEPDPHKNDAAPQHWFLAHGVYIVDFFNVQTNVKIKFFNTLASKLN